MEDRKAYVNFGKGTSKNLQFRAGLLQGSVLEPLLFLIFINDITEDINDTTTTLFADDLAILCQGTIKEAEVKAQDSLDKVAKWAKKWKMIISQDKTECLLLTTSTTEATGVKLPNWTRQRLLLTSFQQKHK